MIFGGDFRQILSVIPKAPRGEVVNSSLNMSRLWNHCHVFFLQTNMCLGKGKNHAENIKIANFAKWVLDVGDGRVQNIHPENVFSDPKIIIPEQFIIDKFTDSVKSNINVTYPDFQKKYSSESYLKERAIPTPTNAIVDQVNSQVLDLIPGTTYTYLSQDSIDDSYPDTESDYESSFPIEYLNSINLPSILKHELKLKVGSVVMLIRNLNQIIGLCNGTRMVLTKCLKNSVECKILTGSHAGTKHLIPRIEMEPTDTRFPFVFKRIQFPLQICFAMTINKSQGQSLEKVGLFLPRPPFSHGQLYVAVSWVTTPDGLHILIEGDDGKPREFTANIVFDEVFYTLPVVDG